MKYGYNTENLQLIIDKAKTKNDGYYNFRGICYRVSNNYVTHIIVNGDILEKCYGFYSVIGHYKDYKSEGVKKLKEMLKNL